MDTKKLKALQSMFGKAHVTGREKKESKSFYMKEIVEANEVVELIGVISDIQLERESLGLHAMNELMLNARRKIAFIEQKEKEQESE